MNSSKLLKMALGISVLFLTTHLAHAQAPEYRFDSNWPERPIPNMWWMQGIRGLVVDHEGLIWVLNHPDGITQFENYAQRNPPAAACCVAAPAIVVFNAEGRVVNSWNTETSIWPTLHGLAVDTEGYVWVGSDTVYKYTRDGRLVGSIPRAPENGAPQGGYAPDTKAVVGGIEEIKVDEDANEVYFVDNYLKGRVMVYDSNTLAFKRGWGAFGKPLNEISRDAGSQTYNPNGPPAKDFLGHVTLGLSNDGLVYVADRVGNRIQVFTKTGDMMKEFYLARETLAGGSAGGIAFSADAEQRHLLVPDLVNGTIWILNRENGSVLSRVGSPGPYAGQFNGLHMLAVDSQGTLYTGEVLGKRLQRFLRAN